MKEHWKFNKEKFISAEEGLTSTEPVTGGSIRKCDSLIKYVKLILYIEVILFLGWSGYILYQSNYFAIRDVECSTVPAEVLKLSSLKELEYTVDEIKEHGPSKEDVITTEILPTNDQLNVHGASWENDINLNENERFKDTLKPKSNEDKEILVKVPSLDASEFKESDSLEEDGSIMDWGFPFLWQIHKEIGPSTDDSTDTVSDSEVEEKDESNDTSESYQASLDKTEEWLNGEGSYNSEDIRYSMEILKNLSDLLEMMKAARENSNLESLRKDDDSSESRENLKNNKETLLWGESTGSNVSLPNELGNGVLIWKPVESENLDTSEADEMISDPKSDFWTPSITPRVVVVPSVEEQSDGETQYTEDSTEKNAFMETDNAAINEEDSSPIVSKRWKSFFNVPSDTATSLEIENADSNSSTADTNEEDSSPIVSKRWKSFFNVPSDTATSFQIENAESNLSTADTNEEDYSPLVINRFSNLHYNSESTDWEAPAATTNDENSSTVDNIWGFLATSPTDAATPLPKENVASATHITDTSDEENGPVIDNAWNLFWNSYDDPDISSSKENKDLVIDYTWGSLSDSYDDYAVDTSSATNNEEDVSLSTDRPQERFSNVDDIFARHFKMESADEEKKDIQFGPRLKTDDLTDPCSVEFVNGIRILKCSWNSADGSSDSSVTTESVSDSKTKGFYIFHKEPWTSKVAIGFGR